MTLNTGYLEFMYFPKTIPWLYGEPLSRLAYINTPAGTLLDVRCRTPGDGLVARPRGGALNVHAGHEDAAPVAREHVTHAHKQGDVGQLPAQR